MRIFGRKKAKEEEELKKQEELEAARKPARRKFRDLNPDAATRRKAPPKPWGKKERLWVLGVFLFMAITAGVLAASARSWKLPGMPKLSLPNLSLEETYVIEKPQVSKTKNYDELKARIEDAIRDLSGIYGVYAWDIENKTGLGINEAEIMQAASLIKLPIMVGLFKEVELGRIGYSYSERK
jgi:hypothetical protein